MTVNIDVEVSRQLHKYKETAKSVIEKVLENEEFPFEAEVSIMLTDNKGIQNLNREYRGIDSATDVLSFPMIDFDKPGCFEGLENKEDIFNPETGEAVLGDIVISLDKVSEQAKAFGHSEKREYAFLVAHSMYHLLGYDHVNSEEEAKIMEEKQERTLSELGITRQSDRNTSVREKFKDKKRIVIKLGSSTIAHNNMQRLDLVKLERLVREVSDLRNSGKEVVIVSSGAVMVGRATLGIKEKPGNLTEKQAYASVGQAKLMMIYQKLFSEYNQVCSQILMSKNTMIDNLNRFNARNTFNELLSLGVIPIVNENDTIATYGVDSLSYYGDNDTLSAVVASLIHADLLILLSDIDGFYTDNPKENPDAKFIDLVEKMNEDYLKMGKGTALDGVGTGGMATKLTAARIATVAGADMVIASGDDFRIIHEIIEGKKHGTVFLADPKDEFYVIDFIEKI